MYADDVAMFFSSRDDLTRATRVLFRHFRAFGLLMHTGQFNCNNSKTKAMYFPHSPSSVGDTRSFRVTLGGDRCIEFTDKIVYLGSVITSNLSCNGDVENRIAKATKAFGALRPVLSRKHLSSQIKGRIYMCLVLSILLYGSECWCLTAANLHQLTVFHRTCVRKMNRVNLYHTWQHHISAEELQSRLGLKDIESYLNTRLLSWVGHIARMSDNRPPRQFLTCWVPHERQSGRPPKTWGARVDEALQYFEIPTDFKDWMELAQDRQKWRKLARGLTDSSEE